MRNDFYWSSMLNTKRTACVPANIPKPNHRNSRQSYIKNRNIVDKKEVREKERIEKDIGLGWQPRKSCNFKASSAIGYVDGILTKDSDLLEKTSPFERVTLHFHKLNLKEPL